MKCEECEIAEQKKHILYEDELVIAALADRPSTVGHIMIIPKEHQPILEKTSDDLFGHMMIVANKISTVCFELLGAQGTNLVIRNGITAGQKTSHTKIHIIPRKENDGLNFEWKANKANEEELSLAELELKTELERPPEQKPIEIEKPNEEDLISGEDNYLIKSLDRNPD